MLLFSTIPEETQNEILLAAKRFDPAMTLTEVFHVKWPKFVKCLTIFLANHESFAHEVKVPKDWVHAGVVKWLEGLDLATYCTQDLDADPKEYRKCKDAPARAQPLPSSNTNVQALASGRGTLISRLCVGWVLLLQLVDVDQSP